MEKEVKRLKAELAYQSAKDLETINDLKLDNKTLQSLLTLSEHSLTNAIKKIKGLQNES